MDKARIHFQSNHKSRQETNIGHHKVALKIYLNNQAYQTDRVDLNKLSISTYQSIYTILCQHPSNLTISCIKKLKISIKPLGWRLSLMVVDGHVNQLRVSIKISWMLQLQLIRINRIISNILVIGSEHSVMLNSAIDQTRVVVHGKIVITRLVL
ncbi:hypothetical protein BpHYR1_019470 [Brachionus plicatilis]|uniref:Uncharacterized protein n=1 Tax=Brachionus plicatilis TaxID=10195 RepID=A0A3M7RCM7_BRAPC|nr:hypothetical protein BpHYR1_019470 [Brachionus plicatilis]